MKKVAMLLNLLLPLAALPAEAVDVDEIRHMNRDARLTLQAKAGRYIIAGDGGQQLSVRGSHAGRASVEIAGTADAWWISVHSEDGEAGSGDATAPAELTITVPRGIDLEAETSSGELTVRGIAGRRMRITTVSGHVRADEVAPERLSIETINGRQHVTGSGSSNVRLESVSGDIQARYAGGHVYAKSMSGDLRLDIADFADLEARTVSGSVYAGLNPRAGSAIRTGTHTGAVSLALPEQTRLDLRAESHSGRIDSDFGGESERRNGSNRRLHHRTGDGSVLAELSSFSGPIQVRAGEAEAMFATVLVYREEEDGHGYEPARIGADETILLDLKPGQFGTLELPRETAGLFVQGRDSQPYGLEVESWGTGLQCLRVVRDRSSFSILAGADDRVRARQVLPLFELEHVACPEPAFLEGFDRVGQVTDGSEW